MDGLLDKIMAYEQGELDEDEWLDLFQQLVDNGLAWTLQGQYGRTAHSLLKAGLIIPADHPVKPLYTEEQRSEARDLNTCGTCDRSWDDAVVTSITPVPSGRCPFEYFHAGQETER